jgi:hypothetical protein
MTKINDNVEFESGVELGLQNAEFIAWFNENIQSKITFCDGNYDTVKTCTTLDKDGRPKSWVFTELTVKAIYFTPDSNKLDFNKFIIYATI